MNAIANPQVQVAVLKARLALASNASVKAEPGCFIVDAEFGGNSVRVEYAFDAGESGSPWEPETPPKVELLCFWHAGVAFDLDRIAMKQLDKWEALCLSHAEKQRERAAQEAAEHQYEAAEECAA